MALGANPLVNPAALDILVVAGVPTQGVFRLLDAEGRPYKWDTKDRAGAEGATQTYRGWELANFTGRIECWTAEQIDYTEQFIVPLLIYEATKQNPTPVAIYHPLLAARQVNSAIVKNSPVWVDLGNQLWSLTYKFEEFRPAKPKNVTTTPDKQAATSAAKANQKPSVNDSLRKRAAELLEQWQRPFPSS